MLTREQFEALLARLRGEGDPLNAEELRSLIAALPEHGDDAELAEIEQLCQALGDDDAVELDTIRAAVELVEAVRAEADVRLTAAEAEATERETLRRQLAGEEASDTGADGDGGEGDGADAGDAGEGGEGGDGDAGGDGGDGTEGADAGDGAGEGTQAEPVGATAAGTPRRTAPGQLRNRRTAGTPRPRQARAHNQIVRDGGGEYADLGELSEAMVARRQTFLNSARGHSEKIVLGSIVAEYPPERLLDPMNPALNQSRMAAVTAALQNRSADELDAVTASGGFCAPFSPYYGFQRLAEADRPMRAGFEAFGAGSPRGGIIFRTPPDFPSFADAVDFWSEANDITPGSDGPATKPCMVVPCSDTETAQVYAITECLTFGNFLARTDPETVQNATDNTMAAFARKADTRLIDLTKAASTHVTAGTALGAFRDLVYHMNVAAVGYRSRHRMRRDAMLEVRMPAWVLDMARLDLMRQLPGDGTENAAEDLLNRALANANLRIAALYIDSPTTGTSQVFGAQTASGLLDFPADVQWQLGAPGSFFLLDNGRLDLGVVRDSILNATNDYQTFAESFEGLAFLGLESLWVTSTVCPSGATASTVDPSDFCSGNYVPA